MADFIYTSSGRRFYPLNPRAEDIDIKDIAHALSMLCRANGHFSGFHSVAQHCIECCMEAKVRGYGARVSLACLLHDASEAYMSDVTTPVKNKMDFYRECEDRLINMIFEKYIGKLTDEELQKMWHLDKVLLYHEFYHFTSKETGINEAILSEPDFTFRNFADVENEYLELFNTIRLTLPAD